MKFISPKLEIDEEATGELVESALSSLKGEVDSFAILSESEMSYVQALVTENGFIVQFQNGSIDQHYEFEIYLSRPQTISLFQAYLEKSPNWQGSLQYKKVNLRGFWGNLGLTLGRFIGGFIRGFKDTRKKT